MTRRLALMLPAAALALVLAGCFVLIRDDSAEQRSLIGSVSVETSICSGLPGGGPFRTRLREAVQRGPGGELSCQDPEDIVNFALDEGGEAILMLAPRQLLVAYRVPEGAAAPATFSADVDAYPFEELVGGIRRLLVENDLPEPVTQTVTFRRSESLEDELPDWLAEGGGEPGTVLPDGSRFVGYVSDVVVGQPAADIELSVDFGLPAGAGDQPYAGPFNHVTLAGSRLAIDDGLITRGPGLPFGDLDPERPVSCGDPEEDATLCPFPLFEEGQSPEEGLVGTDLATRDLRIVPGAPVTVEQGQTASVPFTFRAAGPAADQLLSLAADVSVQDGKATPVNPTWLFAGTGEHAEAVSVQVPHYTDPGQYVVRLVATVGDQSREATGVLNVVAKTVPVELPGITPEAPLPPPDNLYYRRGGVKFGYICTAAASDCADTSAELFVDPVAYRTRAVGLGVLELAGWAEPFGAKVDKRVEGEVRVFRKARRALRAGRTLSGQLHINSGGAKPIQIRRVLVRIKKPAS